MGIVGLSDSTETNRMDSDYNVTLFSFWDTCKSHMVVLHRHRSRRASRSASAESRLVNGAITDLPQYKRVFIEANAAGAMCSCECATVALSFSACLCLSLRFNDADFMVSLPAVC